MVFLGVGLPDDQIHAPNEKVNLSMLYRGAEAAALLWSKFAARAARPCAQRNGGYVHGADGQPMVTTRTPRPHTLTA